MTIDVNGNAASGIDWTSLCSNLRTFLDIIDTGIESDMLLGLAALLLPHFRTIGERIESNPVESIGRGPSDGKMVTDEKLNDVFRAD